MSAQDHLSPFQFEGIDFNVTVPKRQRFYGGQIRGDHPDVEGKAAALLIWHPDGEIKHAVVDPSLQRRGVATEMLRRARQINPDVHHSSELSDDGRAWSEARP